MGLLPMTQHDSSLFTRHREPGGGIVLTTWISDLRIPPGQEFERVFDDACDVGIAVRSARTGNVEVFALYEYLKDREGEVQGWTFQPVNRSLEGLVGVTVYND